MNLNVMAPRDAERITEAVKRSGPKSPRKLGRRVKAGHQAVHLRSLLTTCISKFSSAFRARSSGSVC
jgi:hypothetical protein